MTQAPATNPGGAAGRAYLWLPAIVTAGLVVGWPSLDGRFLGGDDENLILNHVLVARPSVEHAVKLFEIVHRDLYQPVPLLTFQLQFASLAHRQGQPDFLDALLFRLHLGNVLIHVLNGVLLFVLVRRLSGRAAVAGLAAVLFEVHPLGVECVAWLNGRMIALSVTFSLAALIAVDVWRRRLLTPDARPWALVGWAFAAVALGTLAMMCKVRLGLGVLMVLVSLWPSIDLAGRPSGLLRDRRWWCALGAFAAISVLFLWINVNATTASRMFEGGRDQLTGPGGARVILALGWYITHYIWPAGLAPWYAPPKTVGWFDGTVLVSGAVVAAASAALWLLRRRHPIVLGGALWFIATVATTLPFVPSRNLLVADRYVYLANIGLHWMVAAAVVGLAARLGRGGRGAVIVAVAAVVGLAAVASRQVAGYYHDDEAKISRMVAVSPDASTLQTAWGWYDFERGDYDSAIVRADDELRRFDDDPVAVVRALDLRAMSRYEGRGDVAGAINDLETAIALHDTPKSRYRMAVILAREGRKAEALTHLRQAVNLSDLNYNPATKLLARLLLERSEIDEAYDLYGRVLTVSAGYDLDALFSMGEIAARRGDYAQAAACLQRAFDLGGDSVEGRLNLVISLKESGRVQEADEHYRILRMAWEPEASPEFLLILAGFALSVGDAETAAQAVSPVLAADGADPRARLITALLALREGPEALMAAVDGLATLAWTDADFQYAFNVLESLSLVDPGQPWPYYVTAVMLKIQGRSDIAVALQQRFEQTTDDPRAVARLRRVLESE